MGTVSIAHSSGTISPDGFSEYQATASVPTVIHQALDGSVSYVLYPGGPRSGTLRLSFSDYAAADAAYEIHRASGQVFELTDTLVSGIGMDYVVTGDCSISASQAPGPWLVLVPFGEVE